MGVCVCVCGCVCVCVWVCVQISVHLHSQESQDVDNPRLPELNLDLHLSMPTERLTTSIHHAVYLSSRHSGVSMNEKYSFYSELIGRRRRKRRRRRRRMKKKICERCLSKTLR